LLITHGNEEHWFHMQDEVEKYLNENQLTLDIEQEEEPTLEIEQEEELTLETEQEEAGESSGQDSTEQDSESAPNADPEKAIEPEIVAPMAHLTELHEVRTINSGLKELSPLGFSVDDLIPAERTGSTTARFELIRGEDAARSLKDLRDLLPQVRAAGEKGLQVTRFKGLGEMNAEELRETTLDPQNRTLLRVNLTDAGAADEMFRLLMGDKVEPRREFIEKHALDVRNLDV
jgi:DNA gyrase subunit B